MKQIYLMSNAIVAIVVFSLQDVVFAQSLREPPEKPVFQLPLFQRQPDLPEFALSLVKPDERDDEIKKRRREQLAEALLSARISAATFDRPDVPKDALSNVHKYLNLAADVAFGLVETDEQKIACLEFQVENTKRNEQIVSGQSAKRLRFDVSDAKYLRLEAEINLLKFKRDSALARGLNGLVK